MDLKTELEHIPKIPAGDYRIKINGQSPKVDCRIIAEDELWLILETAMRDAFTEGIKTEAGIRPIGQTFDDYFNSLFDNIKQP